MISASETEVTVAVPFAYAATEQEAKRYAGLVVGRKRALGANPRKGAKVSKRDHGWEVRFERY